MRVRISIVFLRILTKDRTITDDTELVASDVTLDHARIIVFSRVMAGFGIKYDAINIMFITTSAHMRYKSVLNF